MILFGTVTIRPTKLYKSQSIGTRFFVLGIPLIPLNSYFFSGSKAILETGIYWKHAIKIYAFDVGLISLLYTAIGLKSVTASVLVVLATAIFIFLFDSTSKEEKKKRDLVQEVIGINVIPKYLDYQATVDIYNKLQEIFTKKYNQNWKEILENNKYLENKIPHLLTLIIFERSFLKTKKNELILEYLWNKYSNKNLG